MIKNHGKLIAAIEAVPLTLLVSLGLLWWAGWPGIASGDGGDPPLYSVSVSSSEQLEAVFEAREYFWPSDEEVPPITVQSLPADLESIDPELRKSLFFRAMLPVILAENTRIEAQRRQLMMALDNNMPEGRRLVLISQLAEEYGVEGDPLAPETWQALRQRVNSVPVALALAQAAKESGWGTSRFAREGNNFFGEWTWDSSIGIAPEDRPEDASHYVRAFQSPRQSVRSYMRNLNSHDAYQRFRILREQAHRRGGAMSPIAMTAGLNRYSERGYDYVEEIRNLIVANRLVELTAEVALIEPPARPGRRELALR